MAATRLRAVSAHLAAGGEVGVVERPHRGRPDQPRLLTDAQVRQFIATGYLSLPVDDTAPSVHRLIHAKGQEINEHGTVDGNPIGTHQPGNDIFPVIPELGDIMCGGTVKGALNSLVGAGWSMAAHRHMHGNIAAGNPDQSFHKDSQRQKPSLHRPRQIFVFYVPRGATLQMGATGIVPGSQFVSADEQDWSGVNVSPAKLSEGFHEVKLTTPLDCGTVVLAHHGMIHRASARLKDDQGHPWRPMMKFIFARRSEPGDGPPSWNHDPRTAEDTPWEELASEPALAPAMQSIWEWMLGAHAVPDSSVHSLVLQQSLKLEHQILLAPWEAGDEGRRVGAAYRLGRAAASAAGTDSGEQAVQLLMAALTHPGQQQAPRRSAVHGLQAAGQAAVPALIAHMRVLVLTGARVDNHEAIMLAGDALGEAAFEPTLEVIETMRSALECLTAMAERSERLRRWAAGLAKREQWQADADTAATSILLALQPLALRAVARDDVRVGAAIFAAICPFLLPQSASLWWAIGNSHLHGFNSGDVVGAAVNVGASLLQMPDMRELEGGALWRAMEREAAVEKSTPQQHSAQAALNFEEGEPYIA